jgi:hypothetical protein
MADIYSAVIYQKNTTASPAPFSSYPNIHGSNYTVSTGGSSADYMSASLIEATTMNDGDVCVTGIVKADSALPSYCYGHYNQGLDKCIYSGQSSPASYSNGAVATFQPGTPYITNAAFDTLNVASVYSNASIASWGYCDTCYPDGSCCNYDGVCNQPDDQNCPDCSGDGCAYVALVHGYIGFDCDIHCDTCYTWNYTLSACTLNSNCSYQPLCGNDNCEYGEDGGSCPQDCAFDTIY